MNAVTQLRFIRNAYQRTNKERGTVHVRGDEKGDGICADLPLFDYG